MYAAIEANKRKSTLLVIVFFVFVMALGLLMGVAMDAGLSPMIFATIFAVVMSLFSFYGGDKVALSMAGAQQIEEKDNPYVYRMVENLAITAGLPTPKVYIIPTAALNAFATGRDPEHASVAVTQGLIERLENEELEGVIAHEIAHIQNYDIRLMMMVVVLIGVVGIMSDMFTRSLLWGGSDSDNKNNNAIMIIVALVFAILAPIVAKMIQLAISRKREFLADATGALLTRYPEGLASALEKITADPVPMEKVSSATAHMYISNPLKGKSKLANLFSTHPPAEERIKALRNM
jgi:heat shock protein HtpX